MVPVFASSSMGLGVLAILEADSIAAAAITVVAASYGTLSASSVLCCCPMRDFCAMLQGVCPSVS
jgi:hypothetical protein